MAYRKGDPLLLEGPANAALSWVATRTAELAGWPFVRLMYGFSATGRENMAFAPGSTAGRPDFRGPDFRGHDRRKPRILPSPFIRPSPCIFVSNHCLPLDPLLHALSIFPRRTHFTLLEDTCAAPALGRLVRLLGGIPLPDGGSRLKDIEKAVETALERRGMIHFYPEGECFLRGQEIRRFKAGAFYFAIRFGVPVIPLVTVLKKRPRRIHGAVRAGAPPLEARIHVLKPIVPPPSRGRPALDLRSALVFAEEARMTMQKAIDKAGGDKSLYLGPMPRIKGVNDRPGF